jgi:hypothetical protein
MLANRTLACASNSDFQIRSSTCSFSMLSMDIKVPVRESGNYRIRPANLQGVISKIEDLKIAAISHQIRPHLLVKDLIDLQSRGSSL